MYIYKRPHLVSGVQPRRYPTNLAREVGYFASSILQKWMKPSRSCKLFKRTNVVVFILPLGNFGSWINEMIMQLSVFFVCSLCCDDLFQQR